jgi:hypothetical protein
MYELQNMCYDAYVVRYNESWCFMATQSSVDAALEMLPADGSSVAFEEFKTAVMATGKTDAAQTLALIVQKDLFAGKLVKNSASGKLELMVARRT